MDAVEARRAPLLQQPGHGLVGRDHEVLDQAMGLGLRAGTDLADVAAPIKGELGLLRVEHQRALLLARAPQRRGRRARRV